MARPREEKSLALLNALAKLTATGQSPTMRELAHASLLSIRDARMLLGGLIRGGHVIITGYRRVHYRNRPVAEYGTANPDQNDQAQGSNALANALSCWR